MAEAIRLPLELFYERETRHPNKLYMVQPLVGGQLQELTWGDVGDQARRAANWLRSRELPQGSRIAIISKNCAHWIIADLAIWDIGSPAELVYRMGFNPLYRRMYRGRFTSSVPPLS